MSAANHPEQCFEAAQQDCHEPHVAQSYAIGGRSGQSRGDLTSPRFFVAIWRWSDAHARRSSDARPQSLRTPIRNIVLEDFGPRSIRTAPPRCRRLAFCMIAACRMTALGVLAQRLLLAVSRSCRRSASEQRPTESPAVLSAPRNGPVPTTPARTGCRRYCRRTRRRHPRPAIP